MDTYPYSISDEGPRNYRDDAGQVAGFELDIRIDYYRGIVLSMIDRLAVVVDGTRYESDVVGFRLPGGDRVWSDADRLADGDTRWQWGDWATLVVPVAGGVTPGEHTITLEQDLRVSYMPNHLGKHVDTKTITVAA
jgi:hypothetical protein